MVENLLKLGLNTYEARAYRALLSSGRGSAAYLSKRSGVPRARIYDVLTSLSSKGFAAKTLSKPVEFLAISPSKAIDAMAVSRRRDLDSSIAETIEMAKALEKSSKPAPDDSRDYVLMLEGRRSIYSLIGEKLGSCSDRVYMASPQESLERKHSFFAQHLKDLASRGVKVISRPSKHTRCVVFDRSSVLFFLNDSGVDDGSDRAIFVNSPYVANYFSRQ